MLLAVKLSINTHCLFRETGQLPLYSYWLCCCPLLEQPFDDQQCLAERDQWSWFKAGTQKRKLYIWGLFCSSQNTWGWCAHLCYHEPFQNRLQHNFQLLLREQMIWEWKGLDQVYPHDAHVSSRVMRIYHTYFEAPLGSQTGWWDDQKRATKPTLPSYLRHNVPNHLSRALSRLTL